MVVVAGAVPLSAAGVITGRETVVLGLDDGRGELQQPPLPGGPASAGRTLPKARNAARVNNKRVMDAPPLRGHAELAVALYDG